MKKIVCIASLTLLAFATEGSSHGRAIRSVSVIARCVEDHEASLAYAYETTFKGQPTYPEVKAVVGFDITADGDVENEEITSLEGFDTVPGGPALSAMFADKINEVTYPWKFPRIDAGVVRIELPFVFKPVENTEDEIEGVREAGGVRGVREYYIDYPATKVIRENRAIYVFKEFEIKCRHERAVPVNVPRRIYGGEEFANAAKGETEKRTRGFLKDIGSYFNKCRKPAAEGLSKKAARRERELDEVETALTKEELRLTVADLGLAEGYDWGVKKADVKKAAKLRDKQGRLTAEIESLRGKISAAEETRAQSLAYERDALITRGKELSGEASPGSDGPWLSLALADLYFDAGEGAKAAPLFERVLQTGDEAATPEALYGLAHACDAAGDEEKASQTFLSLTTEYPDLAYQGETCFRLGEYFTSRGEAERADEYYLLAAEADAQYRDAALYRAAWGYYECSNPFGTLYYDRAAPAFGRFLEGADESSAYWDHAIMMAGVCLAEWEPGTAERPAPLDALSRYDDVFGETGESAYAADVLRALGNAYLYRMDRLPEAATTYEYLLKEHPTYGDAAGVIKSMVESDLRREAYDDAHVARLRLVDEYGPASSWYRAQDEPTGCRALLDWENALYEVAVYFNMQGERKTRTNPEEGRGFFEKAIDRYNQYLTSFPTNEKAYHINFYLAEVYFAIEDYDTAAQQYIKTATYYTDRERYKIDKWDEKFTGEASFFNAVIAYDEIYQKEIEEKRGAAALTPQRISPRPLTEAELNLAQSCEGYLQYYPESKERPTVLSKAGEVYFNGGDFEKARVFFSQVLDEPPPRVGDYHRRDYDVLYVYALVVIAKTYLAEAEALSAAGNAADSAAKRAEYEAWLERAKAEAGKRNVDSKDIKESLE